MKNGNATQFGWRGTPRTLCRSIRGYMPLNFLKNQKNRISANLATVFVSYCLSVMSPGHKIGLPEYGLPTFVRKIDERPFWISALIFWMKNNRARG